MVKKKLKNNNKMQQMRVREEQYGNNTNYD